MIHTASGSCLSLTTYAHLDYTSNHLLFPAANEMWHWKASAAGNIKCAGSVRVSMVIIKPGGQGTVTTIGVSLQVNQVFYMLTNGLQSYVEGITGLDPHIGGAELHQLCYNALQPA
jgi:hypothetical protein